VDTGFQLSARVVLEIFDIYTCQYKMLHMILNCSEYPITVDYIYIDRVYNNDTTNKLVLVIVCHGTCIPRDSHVGIVLQIIEQASTFSFNALANMLRENESQTFKFNKWYNQHSDTTPVFSECKVKLMMLDVVDKNTIICSLSNVFSVNGYVHTSRILPFPFTLVGEQVSDVLPELLKAPIEYPQPEDILSINATCSISLLHAKLGETFYVTYSPPSASFYHPKLGSEV
jgi:hypothetical protein